MSAECQLILHVLRRSRNEWGGFEGVYKRELAANRGGEVSFES